MTSIAILFPNVAAFNAEKIKEICTSSSLIVAIDGGVGNAMQIAVIPDIVIGDMDSVSPRAKNFLKRNKTEILLFPVEKDKTDFELAIDYVLAKGLNKIVIAGLSGGRTDHALGNWSILINLFEKRYLENITVLEKDQTISFVRSEWKSAVKRGDIISILPLPGGADGVSTKGLKHKLTADKLKFGTSRGISNRAQDKNVRIRLKQGSAMIVHHHLCTKDC